MHRPHVAPFALATVLAAALAACTDQSTPTPTQPRADVTAVTKPSGATCDDNVAKLVYSQINALFTGSVQTQARTLFGNVVTACPGGLQAATAPMLTYVQYTIDQYNAGAVLAPSKTYATREDAVVDDWKTVFTYVYNNNPALTVPTFSPTVLRVNGGAKVLDATAANVFLVNNSWTAGIYVPDQNDASGVTGPRLFTITPADANCLVTNLKQNPVCFLFNADPKPTMAFSPLATVGECEATAVPANHTIAHLVGSQTRLTLKTSVPAAFSTDGQTPHLCAASGYQSPYAYSDGLGPAAWYALGRAASTALDLLSPQPAWASHTTGIGGSTPGLSPFSPVVNWIFQGTFSTPPNTVGAPPSSTADVGFFDVISATPPGSILVQSSIGDPVQGLLQQPVVLQQAGGACTTTCGGLTLRARDTTYSAAGTQASYGSYLVSWQSLEDKPTLKSAPFVLRGSDGLVIARLAYEMRNSHPVLTYNGTVLTTVTWAQHVAQLFEVVVDLDNKVTTLRVGPRDGPTTTILQNVPFVTTQGKQATDLKYVAAEFTGIDAGTIGWDNILFSRLTDTPAP